MLSSVFNSSRRHSALFFSSSLQRWDSIRKLQPPSSSLIQIPQNAMDDSPDIKALRGLKFFHEFHDRGFIKLHALRQQDQNIPSVSAGWLQAEYLFSSHQELRSSYKKFREEELRFGMILEEMDAIAGDSCYKYVMTSPFYQNDQQYYLVTASVDQISFCQEFSTNSDLRLTAYPIWHGSSSLMTTIDFEARSSRNHQYQLLGHALFIFVARRLGKSIQVPSFDLSPHDPAQAEDLCRAKDRFEFGALNAKQRRAMAKESLFRDNPPTEQESLRLHSLFSRATRSNYIPMSSTEHKSVHLMHSQERNRHGNIFGGYLMRLTYELAWSTALLYGKGLYPNLIHCEEVSFIRPVHIGDTLGLTSKVVFSKSNHIFVFVRAANISHNKSEATTNELRFVFKFEGQVRQVYPETYEEGLVYLEAQRRFNRKFEHQLN